MSNFKDLVRIGKDAVIRNAGSKPVAGFSAAFDSGWGDKKQTVWLDCSLWGDRATKLAPYLTKGSQVLVEGELGTREYEGKTYLTLNVSEVKLTGKPQGQRQESQPNRDPDEGAAERQESGDFPQDDIPF